MQQGAVVLTQPPLPTVIYIQRLWDTPAGASKHIKEIIKKKKALRDYSLLLMQWFDSLKSVEQFSVTSLGLDKALKAQALRAGLQPTNLREAEFQASEISFLIQKLNKIEHQCI